MSYINALRLCLGFGAERRELYLQAEDFFIDKGGTRSEKIEFHLTFSEPGKREQGYNSMCTSLMTAIKSGVNIGVEKRGK